MSTTSDNCNGSEPENDISIIKNYFEAKDTCADSIHEIKDIIKIFDNSLSYACENKNDILKNEIIKTLDNSIITLIQHVCDLFTEYQTDSNVKNIISFSNEIFDNVYILNAKYGIEFISVKNKVAKIISDTAIFVFEQKLYPDYLKIESPTQQDYDLLNDKARLCYELLKEAEALCCYYRNNDIRAFENTFSIIRCMNKAKSMINN